MLKYINTDVVFQEIPDEVTLAINISNCPCHCPECHSKFLWADNGIELNASSIEYFVEEFGKDVTCICFMGGDSEPDKVNELAKYIKQEFAFLKTGWYTGKTLISSHINIDNFDYIKVGPYIKHLGPLKNPKTNQRLFKINHEKNIYEDITNRFWKQQKK